MLNGGDLENIYPIESKVTQQQRERLLNQKAILIWFTGFSGSGKSTLAIKLECALHAEGFKTYFLDGDNLRSGLNNDLNFDTVSRRENIRRVGEVSKLLLEAGTIVLAAFISPLNADRDEVKRIVGAANYLEIFVDAPLNVCEERDVKGLYEKARRGEIRDFTGISSPYETPKYPDVYINTSLFSVQESVVTLMNFVTPRLFYQPHPVTDDK